MREKRFIGLLCLLILTVSVFLTGCGSADGGRGG